MGTTAPWLSREPLVASWRAFGRFQRRRGVSARGPTPLGPDRRRPPRTPHGHGGAGLARPRPGLGRPRAVPGPVLGFPRDVLRQAGVARVVGVRRLRRRRA